MLYNVLVEEKKIIYFNDELNDEFFGEDIKSAIIDGKYKYYSKNFFYNLIQFVYYRLIILPIAFLYCKLFKRIKFVNKKVLKQAKGGYFVFANHTHNISDAFSPNIICQPKKPYIIVNSKNLGVPVLGKSTKMLGALPLPSTVDATRNFFDVMSLRLSQKTAIIIYPEAHIWPFYTKIRPFVSASFKYPIKYDVPAFCFTTTYQMSLKGKCKIVIYIDGPFYANNDLIGKDKQEDLRNRVYQTMAERSKLSNFETIKYIKKEEVTND